MGADGGLVSARIALRLEIFSILLVVNYGTIIRLFSCWDIEPVIRMMMAPPQTQQFEQGDPS